MKAIFFLNKKNLNLLLQSTSVK